MAVTATLRCGVRCCGSDGAGHVGRSACVPAAAVAIRLGRAMLVSSVMCMGGKGGGREGLVVPAGSRLRARAGSWHHLWNGLAHRLMISSVQRFSFPRNRVHDCLPAFSVCLALHPRRVQSRFSGLAGETV